MPYIYFDPLPSFDLTSFGITKYFFFYYFILCPLLVYYLLFCFSSIYHKYHKGFKK